MAWACSAQSAGSLPGGGAILAVSTATSIAPRGLLILAAICKLSSGMLQIAAQTCLPRSLNGPFSDSSYKLLCTSLYGASLTLCSLGLLHG